MKYPGRRCAAPFGVAAAIAALVLTGCGTQVGTTRNTIATADVAALPSGYGVNWARRKHAGVFVRTHGNLKYFDESGYLHTVHESEIPGRTFYVAWEGGRSWFIFLNADGTFPTVEQGRRRNLLEAAPVVRASRGITSHQIDLCMDRARRDHGGDAPIQLRGEFEIDESRIYRGPRLPVELQAPVRIGGADPSGGSLQLVCEFTVVDGAPVFSGTRLLRP